MADDLKPSQNKKEGVIMTDSKELRRLIEEKGFKLKYVAERLGLSSYGLSLKIDNKQEFKTSEVSALCELLEIKSLEQKEKIFFNLKDDYKSTK
jgi:transcriptional regulator with XRE-family HTH domain